MKTNLDVLVFEVILQPVSNVLGEKKEQITGQIYEQISLWSLSGTEDGGHLMSDRENQHRSRTSRFSSVCRIM